MWRFGDDAGGAATWNLETGVKRAHVFSARIYIMKNCFQVLLLFQVAALQRGGGEAGDDRPVPPAGAVGAQEGARRRR
jgi:hypothetical protein